MKICILEGFWGRRVGIQGWGWLEGGEDRDGGGRIFFFGEMR